MTSQLKQDECVDSLLNHKRDGYFLDIGACYPWYMNNTHYFENERNWKGISIEIDPKYRSDWETSRPNSIFILADATKINYGDLLALHNAPKWIDYLSIDIEPVFASLEVLFRVFESGHTFGAISFEVDAGGDVDNRTKTKIPSRHFLLGHGYVLCCQLIMAPNYHVDDVWVHNSIFNESYVRASNERLSGTACVF